MNDILKLIAGRCSVRGYEETMLTDDEIKALVEAGMEGPTAVNRQELHFSVVKRGSKGLEAIKAAFGGREFYYGAPLVILISGDNDFRYSDIDSGIAVENMVLAAEGMGLGSVILGCIKDTLLDPANVDLCKMLDFPENYSFRIAVAIGHIAKPKDPHTFDEAVHVSYID